MTVLAAGQGLVEAHLHLPPLPPRPTLPFLSLQGSWADGGAWFLQPETAGLC